MSLNSISSTYEFKVPNINDSIVIEPELNQCNCRISYGQISEMSVSLKDIRSHRFHIKFHNSGFNESNSHDPTVITVTYFDLLINKIKSHNLKFIKIIFNAHGMTAIILDDSNFIRIGPNET